MAIIPESNYVDISFQYQPASSASGSVPATILFYQSATGSAVEYEDVATILTSAIEVGNTTLGTIATLYNENGGQALITCPYAVGSAGSAVAECLAEYPDVINVVFAEPLSASDMSGVLSALSNKANKYKGILLYALDGTEDITEIGIGDHKNIALLWLPEDSVDTWAAVALAGVLSQFDADETGGISSLQFEALKGVENYVYTGTTTALNNLVNRKWNVVVNVGNRAIVLDGATMIDGDPIHAAWGVSLLETQIREGLSDLLFTKLPYSAESDGALYNSIVGTLNKFVNAGLITAGSPYSGATQKTVYNGKTHTTIQAGASLNNGFVVYSISIGEATQADRTARKTPPIFVYLIVNNNIRTIVVYGEVRA